MLRVAGIGMGKAGSEVMELAKKAYGIEGVAINTSGDDMTTIKSISQITVGDEKGAGKDRNIAKDFMFRKAKEVLALPQLKDLITDHDVIFIHSSTDGGSGSGMAPAMTDVLTRLYPDKHFIISGILPTLKESLAGQHNTIEYLKEVRNFNPTYMLYDNNCRANLTRSDMFTQVNQEIVLDMSIIRGDFQFTTPYTNIDDRDMLKIIEVPGRLQIAKAFGFKEKDIDEKSVEDRLIESIRTSTHAEMDRDQIIKRFGLITNLSEKIHKTFDSNVSKLKELIGEPVDGFEHIYINKTEEEINRVIAIMSGLSIPDDRVEKILQRIDDLTHQLTKTKASSILDKADVDLMDMVRGNGTTTKDSNSDLDDLDSIFGQYIKK